MIMKMLVDSRTLVKHAILATTPPTMLVSDHSVGVGFYEHIQHFSFSKF